MTPISLCVSHPRCLTVRNTVSRSLLIESGAKVWAADEFGAVLDRVIAQVVASNLQRAARKVGATVMVATTHEDLKNALRPDMQITKHYKERVKVEYA